MLNHFQAHSRPRLMRTNIKPTIYLKLLALLVALSLVGQTLFAPAAYAQIISSAPNPSLREACGLDVMLVLDESGSIRDSMAIEQVQGATTAFLDALANTGSQVALIEFGSLATQAIPYTAVTTESGSAGGTMDSVFRPYITSQFDPPDSPLWYTNWNDAMRLAARTNADQRADLVLFVTDGDPTAFNNNHPEDISVFDPNDTAIEDVTYNTISTGKALTQTIAYADLVKNQGTRILMVGVGNALDSTESQERLQVIAGPTIYDGSGSILASDVVLVETFDQLETSLRQIAFALCGPSLTVTMNVDQRDGNGYTPAEGWGFSGDAKVDSPNGATDYEWISPDGATASGQTSSGMTNPNGTLTFQWKPNTLANSSLTVEQEARAGYRFIDVACTVRSLADPDPRPLAVTITGGSFDAELGPNDIASCDVRSQLISSNVAVEVDPPTQLIRTGNSATFDINVTNIGFDELHDVEIKNSHCENPIFTGGDANGDTVLQDDEVWTYTCERPNVTEDFVNIVTVAGKDPAGQSVEPGSDQSTVQVMDPQVAVDVDPPAQYVEYGDNGQVTVLIRNPGDVELYDVIVKDDEPVDGSTGDQCTDLTYVDGDTNGDRILQVDEVWGYLCVVENVTAQVTLNMTVTANDPQGNPVDPAADTAVLNVRTGSICETGGFSGARQRTTVLGVGMGNHHHSFGPATLNVPLTENVLSLYAQQTGKWRGALPESVTIETARERVKMTEYTTLGADPRYKMYTYDTELTPVDAVTFSVDDNVLKGYHTPRGAVLYATYNRQSPYFESIHRINTFVYHGRGKPTHTERVDIPTLSEARDIIVGVVLVDNGRGDGRKFYYTAAAGGVKESVERKDPNLGEELDIFYVKLENVPAGTSEVTLTLDSPPGSDSIEWAGYTVGFECTPDSDGDGVSDSAEDTNHDGDPTNDDSDGDGIADFADLDDDGDGINTADEDANNDFDPTNDDVDGNGTPDYIEGANVAPTDPAPTPVPTPDATGADLSVTQTLLSENEAIAGAQIEYNIVVQNRGPLTATDVVMLNQLDAGVSFHSARIASDADEVRRSFHANGLCKLSEDETAVSCDLGAMAADETAQIIVKVLVDPALAEGTILENSVSVSGSIDDPDAANNAASLATPVKTLATLTLAYEVSNPAPAAGDEIVYTLQVQNSGPSFAQGVSVHAALPEEVTFVESSVDCALEEDVVGRNYACAIGELSASQSVSVTITAKVADDAACGPAWNSLAWTQADNMQGQLFASLDVVAGCVADLQVRQFGNDVNKLMAGEVLTMTLLVENLGPNIASGVVVTGEINTTGIFDVLFVNPDVYGDRDQAACDMISAFNVQSKYKMFECYLNEDFETLNVENGGGRWQVEVVLFGLMDQELATSTGTFAHTADPVLSNNWTDTVGDPTVARSLFRPLDTDGDGTPDYKDDPEEEIEETTEESADEVVDEVPADDVDSDDVDSDGIANEVEGDANTDTDSDGTPDFEDTDSDGDGALDAQEGTSDLNENGMADFQDDTVQNFSGNQPGDMRNGSQRVSSFNARANRRTNRVEITWRAQATANTRGYVLWRNPLGPQGMSSSPANGGSVIPANAIRVTDELIAASSGDQYTFVDELIDMTDTPSEALTYWLQEVKIDNSTVEHASVKATHVEAEEESAEENDGAEEGPVSVGIYLPIVNR